MDSFYDAPRSAPAPTRIDMMNMIRPSVPEVSLLGSSSQNYNFESNGRLWKNINPNIQRTESSNCANANVLKELHNNCSSIKHSHSIQHSSQFVRKQVRFESPVFQQRPSLSYEPFTTRKNCNYKSCEPRKKSILDPKSSLSDVDSCEIAQQNNINLKNKITKEFEILPKQSFEEIYMANIPNRNLDLSIIDIPKISVDVSTKPLDTEETQNSDKNELPKTYKQFLETQKKISRVQKNKENNEAVTDILNYKRKSIDVLNESPPYFYTSYRNEEHTEIPVISSDNGNNSCVHNKNMALLPSLNITNGISKELSLTPKSESLLEQNRINMKDTVTQYNMNGDCFYKSNDHTARCNGNNQTEKLCTKQEPIQHMDNCEPTNRDLLKVIAQQNEQLILLQKQMALLLNRDHVSHTKSIEPAVRSNENVDINRNQINSEMRGFIPDTNMTPRKRNLSKFSVDVMTSFEVAIRAQPNRQCSNNYNSKIQEITEESTVSSTTDINKKAIEPSLYLQEPLKVVETCPSPDPSININMNDYDSSDDELSVSEIGATFYNNLMGQVNNILKQAQIQTKEDLCSRGVDLTKKSTSSKANKTMHRVREATIKHLKDIGVTIGFLDEDNVDVSSGHDNEEYSPSEISYGVKQLLMKYLPDEHLTRIYKKQKPQKLKRKQGELHDILESKPNFSFASLQYMKKYNLLPSSGNLQQMDLYDAFFSVFSHGRLSDQITLQSRKKNNLLKPVVTLTKF